MRKGRSILISAILTLGTAGSILAGSAAAIAVPAIPAWSRSRTRPQLTFTFNAAWNLAIGLLPFGESAAGRSAIFVPSRRNLTEPVPEDCTS